MVKKIALVLMVLLFLVSVVIAGTTITDYYIFVDELNVTGDSYINGNFTGNILYAEMWNYSSNASAWSYVIDAEGVYYNFTGLVEGDCNGFNFTDESQANGGSFLTAVKNGTFKVSSSISIDPAVANDLISFSIAKNWVVADSRECYARVKAGTGVENVGINCLLEVYPGDNVSLLVENEAGSGNVNIHNINLNLVRVGDI